MSRRRLRARPGQEGKKRDPDFTIFLVTLILLGIGLVMVFSASYVDAAESRGDPYFFLRRQIFWALLGITGMLFFSRFDHRRLKRLSPAMVIISFVLLAAIYIPGVGVEIHDARRWIGFGSFLTFQPSEFTKLALVIFSAAYLSSKSIRMENFWSSSFIPLAAAGLSFLFILWQPDMGTGLIILMGVAMVIFLAGMPFKQMAALAGLSIPAILYLIFSAPYRLKRLTSFLDPWADPLEDGYHIIQSLYALGPGGIFGVGLGRSRQKLYYLPEPYNDFIFAIIGEELGFVGATVVILLFFILVWRGMKVALSSPDLFGGLLAAGITFMIGAQALINIGVVTGSLPVTGLNLPLISAGGSSLFFNLCGIGILLNISRYANQ
ncbi:MAG: putative lipid II flippase FtsW [Firmicutes bacterium]|nr:putative lipid II flippase FtsW [Bacillota bacterium]